MAPTTQTHNFSSIYFRGESNGKLEGLDMFNMLFRVIFASLILFVQVVFSATEKTLAISLQNIDCQSCGTSIIETLTNKNLVISANFDRDKAEIYLKYNSQKIKKEQILSVFSEAGRQFVEGIGKGFYQAPTNFPRHLDVKILTMTGEAVPLKENLVLGKITVIDFFADWCGPCRKIDKEMVEILKGNSDVSLRKINIVDWESPAAKKHLKNIPGLPYLRVYSKEGTKIGEVTGFNLKELNKLIRRGIQ